MVLPNHRGLIKNDWRQQVGILFGLISLMWFLEIIDLLLLGGGLDAFGVRPRTQLGLRNIFLSPFLHAGFGHLIANTIPFVVLGWLVMVRRMQDFWITTFLAMLISGGGIWLFGATHSIHIGVSGILFGFLGFILLRSYFERSLQSIALAIIVMLFYGGMLFGVLPGQPGVSWLGHLFGFIGGGAAAYLITRKSRREIERL